MVTLSFFRPSKVTSFEMLQLFIAPNRQLLFYFIGIKIRWSVALGTYMAIGWILETLQQTFMCQWDITIDIEVKVFGSV